MKYLFLTLLFFSSPCWASEEEEALKYALQAISKQYGIDKRLNEWVREQVPEEYIRYAGYVAPVVETVVTGKIKLKWEW